MPLSPGIAASLAIKKGRPFGRPFAFMEEAPESHGASYWVGPRSWMLGRGPANSPVVLRMWISRCGKGKRM